MLALISILPSFVHDEFGVQQNAVIYWNNLKSGEENN